MSRTKKGKRAGDKKQRGRGGGNNGNNDRTDYSAIAKENKKFENYYINQGIVPDEEEFKKFWQSLKDTLPTTWRFTGSKGHAISVRNTLQTHHIPALTNTTFEGALIPAPTPLSWYPDELAWQLTVGKQVIRRSPPFKQLQAFLVSETSSGNISRQEAVSMIPPLLMDVEPHHMVLDMCAAPGSKTSQLIEAIHAGEEERVAEAARRLSGGEGIDTCVDGEPPEKIMGKTTGVVIANDADYKRSHLLIHQTKRLNSPNLIVTNYDATLYPSLRLPTKRDPNGGKTMQEYLKFDRILCDVPCSGDGTVRKNPLIWRDWNAANGNGLWSTQARILVRGLQLLKVGGRLVYSTCSLNPIENESVVHAAIERCGGPSVVEIVDVSDRLPGLIRREGMKSWKVMDKDGTWFENWEEVLEKGVPYTDRLTRGMFPPTDQDSDLANMLNRAVRVYPHLQDTGGFFITVLQKKGAVKAAPEGEKIQTGGQKMKGVRAGDEAKKAAETASDNDVKLVEETNLTSASLANGVKRALSAEDEEQVEPGSPIKRQRLDDTADTPASADKDEDEELKLLDIPSTEQNHRTQEFDEDPKTDVIAKKPRGNFNEEPFKFLSPSHDVLALIKKFYGLSSYFPLDNFLVRNQEGIPVRTIYFTSTMTRQILSENEGRGIRFVHCGVKMFNRQEVQDPEACQWRIQNEGLGLVEAWVGDKRVVHLKQKETLRYLMKELFPRVEDVAEIRERVEGIGGGCCVLRVNIEEDKDELGALVLPLWKSKFTLNLMLPKEERKALLLRLFNDTEGPKDSTREQRESDAKARREAKERGEDEDQDEEMKDEEDDGGIKIDGEDD
ncbi:hypothetical protein TWF569_010024 [Orbilia oligospora]|uniref:SAM-dependent MTase RsmB/NOP-type domain-containing protein n=1 Tax=Orbilia oligospora TaxID=2813651 RepID=A0A7C8NVF7_ORBOL|nr:hypothetical protein TWF569_010024 [Orbilia oligospora]KAF3140970.1 hypothetical protein TWF703_002477 [Orbilia oligospora]